VVWLGVVGDRAAALASEPRASLQAGFEGIAGEDHGAGLRASCSRVTAQHPVGTPIRNVRQLSILSAEELAEIATAMGLEALDPGWLGATMVIEGIPGFSHVPPSSRLQAPSGATFVVDMENRPCQLPAKVIEAARPGFGRAFKPAAEGRRGVTAWVEREGGVALGETLVLHVPDQPVWAHLAAARA
jgi:MOSC domain-containing protein YiiM